MPVLLFLDPAIRFSRPSQSLKLLHGPDCLESSVVAQPVKDGASLAFFKEGGAFAVAVVPSWIECGSQRPDHVPPCQVRSSHSGRSSP